MSDFDYTRSYDSPDDKAHDPKVNTYDLDALRWSTAEEISESLAVVNRAMLARQISPSQAKAAATVANASLTSLKLSVAAAIKQLQADFKALDVEKRGTGGRRRL